MGDQKGFHTQQSARLAFQRQADYDGDSKTYTVRCPVCSAPTRSRPGFLQSKDSVLDGLRQCFNFCPECGRWVCGDCFICFDGRDSVGLCVQCALEKNIAGFTVTQMRQDTNINRR